MAAREGEAKAAAKAAAPDAGAATAAELGILFPDVEIEVRDPDTGAPVTLTVREFRFREGLEAAALARPLIAALVDLAPEGADAALPDPAALDAALGAHAGLWLELVARACGREAAWLARLCDGDAHALTMAMWGANGGFFMRRVVGALAMREGAGSLFRSPASSRTSSAPATDAATPGSARH